MQEAKKVEELEQEGGESMKAFLEAKGFFEDEKEAIEREKVLGLLNSMVNGFIRKVAKSNGIPVDEKSALSRIFTFGSYRLGVHSSGADIDILCIVPNFISRNDFFSIFYDDLCKNSGVSSISKVTDTFVPLIKLKIHSIPIDLLFARLDLPSIPQNISLLDNKLLKHMDEKCILSLNGNRVADEILASVPNVSAFHGALRFIKYWGQERSIYGHAFGYMGGVAYALCVAKTCQLHPSAGPFALVYRFFVLFSKWPFPQPVIIKEVQDCNYNLKVWNPKVNAHDRNNKMPVITPVYPPLCATYNVSPSTLTMMRREFVRGASIIESLLRGEVTIEEALGTLCGPTDFFTRHKNYFVILMACNHQKELSRFIGFAEPKTRQLAARLEVAENISYAYVLPREFEKVNIRAESSFLLRSLGCRSEEEYTISAYFIGIEFSSAKLPLNASRKMNLGKQVADFKLLLDGYEPEEECTLLYDVRPAKQSGLRSILEVFGEESLADVKSRKRKSSEEASPKKEPKTDP